MSARCRQNYHTNAEAEVNKQINLELYASYVCMSMAYHFDRDDIALSGFYKLFKQLSDEKRENVELFAKFQNKRGGRIVLKEIKKPDENEWGTGKAAIETALNLEKTANEALFKLLEVADTNKDDQMADFTRDFISKRVEIIKQLSDHMTNLDRVGEGLGEYQFNEHTLDEDD